MSLHTFKTTLGAERRRDALRRQWPDRMFYVTVHPSEFRYVVATINGENGRTVYVEKPKRKRGTR